MKKRSIILSVLAAACCLVLPVGCDKEEPLVTYTQDEGTARMSRAEVVADTIPETTINFNMVRVKAGTFTMGCFDSTRIPEEPERLWEFTYQAPAHTVNITQDFYIGQTEVTQGLFRSVMGYNPSLSNVGDEYPVENITYEQAMEFCDTLTARTGYTYTLPTEAQWEYAARGGHFAPQPVTLGLRPVYPTYTGSNDIDSVAWYRENAEGASHPVARKAPNVLGLYDMSGNVWEWCTDLFGNYTSGTQTDPAGAPLGSEHVRRGGGWCDYSQFCTPSFRIPMKPELCYPYVGFRIVRLAE